MKASLPRFTDDPVESLIDVLSRHKDIVVDAYRNGGVEDNGANARSIWELRRHRVLIGYTKSVFRLNSSLTKLFDDTCERRRSYSVGANVRETVIRIEKLVDEYEKAMMEGRVDDAENYGSDYDVALTDLIDAIDGSLNHMRLLTVTRFAGVSTLAEKRRQNEFYVTRAEQLGNDLAEISSTKMMDRLDGSIFLEQLAAIYREAVLDRMSDWRSLLLDITNVLKEFLYRLRHVEPQAKLIRDFDLFLDRNDYEPPSEVDFADIPAWAMRAGSVVGQPHPDLSVSEGMDELIDIAETIKVVPDRIVREPQAGRRADDDDEEPEDVVVEKLVQSAFREYASEAGASKLPLSAMGWKGARRSLDAMDDAAWLLYVAYGFRRMDPSAAIGYATMQMERPPSGPWDGTVDIEDFTACKRV